MSDLLNQAKGAATSALNTASNLASQATAAASDLATQAANSQVAATVTEQAKVLGTHATQLAGQAHAQAHAAAPSIVPPPSGGSIDRAHDLSPTSEVDKEKLDKLFAQRANAAELQGKGILKGAPGDSLAGKRAELEKHMLEDKLDKDIAERPTADELVKRGILNPDEAPPAAK